MGDFGGRALNPKSAIRNPKFSGGFSDLAAFDATGANLHPPRAALRQGHADRLQIWVEPARSAVIRVRDIISKLR